MNGKYVIYGVVGYFLISRYLASKTNGTGCKCGAIPPMPPKRGIAEGDMVPRPWVPKLIADPLS